MCAMLAMACFDTSENLRTKYTEQTLRCFHETVDWDRHRLFVADNNSCYETKRVLKFYQQIIPNMKIITFSENVGTAKAISACWANRLPQENLLKADNDIDIADVGWLDRLEEAIDRQPKIGQVGLKRFELEERPDHHNPAWKSELIMLPHTRGQSWIVFEKTAHVLGTCVLHNYRLIDKVGALVQPTNYGWDDSLMSLRSHLAGFINGFLPYIHIEHLDEGKDGYSEWKRQHAGQTIGEYSTIRDEYVSGKRNIYEPL